MKLGRKRDSLDVNNAHTSAQTRPLPSRYLLPFDLSSEKYPQLSTCIVHVTHIHAFQRYMLKLFKASVYDNKYSTTITSQYNHTTSS